MGKTTVRKILKVLAQHKVLLLGLCVLFVLRPTFVEWIKSYVCPLTPIKIDNNGWALGVLIFSVLIVYTTHIKRLWRERELWVSRLWTLLLLFCGWCIFRYAKEFDFYGIAGWKLNYIECAWVAIGTIEVGLFFKRLFSKQEIESDGYPFIADTPALKDKMNRERYAVQLVEKITACVKASKDGDVTKQTDGAFTILLNEPYGVGKTSFMLQLQQIAEKKGVDVCWFKPWLYEDNQKMIVNFIRVLQEKLGEGDGILQQMLSRYAKILSSFKGYEIFSLVRIDGISVETQFEEIKAKLYEKKRPIIVLIDDVDRLQSGELLRTLQMVRNMGDFPYVYYIIAADKVAVQNRLRETGIAAPDEYLKKFFNLEICFPADDRLMDQVLEDGLRMVLRRYGKDSLEIWNFIGQLKYKGEIFANLRDIKRYLNVLDYMLANYQKDMLDEISLRDAAGICIIQCLDSEFYRMLRDHNERFLDNERGHYFQVKKRFANIFTDKQTKIMLDETADYIINGQKTEKDVAKADVDANVHSLADLIRWSNPKKLEVIGELMEILFPQGHASASKVGVCYPTEFFKYFSTIYKGTEMSNAEVVGIMQMNMRSYEKEVHAVIRDGKLEAFKHKLTWYLQTQNYDRIPALAKVLRTFEFEWTEIGLNNKFKDSTFMQEYGASMLAVFLIHKNETLEQTHGAWELMRQQLIHSVEYEQRIRVLTVLSKHVVDYSAYIFRQRELVMACVESSEREFVETVWLKNRYNPAIYRFISIYRDISPKIYEYILQTILDKKLGENVMLHMVKYEKGEIQWNQEFINAVFGTHLIFSYDTSQWLHMVPDKWLQECKRWNMQMPITKEDIANSSFLQYALRFWKHELELTYRESERLQYVLAKKEISEKEYVENFNVSNMTARRDLSKFVRLGYLNKIQEGTQRRYVDAKSKQFENE